MSTDSPLLLAMIGDRASSCEVSLVEIDEVRVLFGRGLFARVVESPGVANADHGAVSCGAVGK